MRAICPSAKCAISFSIIFRSKAACLSPPRTFFVRPVVRFSSDSRSASINSVSTVSASLTGFTSPSTCVISSSSKQRSIWAMASTSRILARNWFPNPSPFAAPLTKPAISTNSNCVGMILADCAKAASSSRRGSGTATRPVFGSIVQNG